MLHISTAAFIYTVQKGELYAELSINFHSIIYCLYKVPSQAYTYALYIFGCTWALFWGLGAVQIACMDISRCWICICINCIIM